MSQKKTPPAPVKSSQFDLFSSFFGDSKDLSNTIELWDTIPKYCVSQKQQNHLRDEKGNLRSTTSNSSTGRPGAGNRTPSAVPSPSSPHPSVTPTGR